MRGRGGGEGVRHGEGAGVAAVPGTVSGSGLYFGDGRVDGQTGGALVVTLRIVRVEVDLKIFIATQKIIGPMYYLGDMASGLAAAVSRVAAGLGLS